MGGGVTLSCSQILNVFHKHFNKLNAKRQIFTIYKNPKNTDFFQQTQIQGAASRRRDGGGGALSKIERCDAQG